MVNTPDEETLEDLLDDSYKDIQDGLGKSESIFGNLSKPTEVTDNRVHVDAAETSSAFGNFSTSADMSNKKVEVGGVATSSAFSSTPASSEPVKPKESKLSAYQNARKAQPTSQPSAQQGSAAPKIDMSGLQVAAKPQTTATPHRVVRESMSLEESTEQIKQQVAQKNEQRKVERQAQRQVQAQQARAQQVQRQPQPRTQQVQRQQRQLPPQQSATQVQGQSIQRQGKPQPPIPQQSRSQRQMQQKKSVQRKTEWVRRFDNGPLIKIRTENSGRTTSGLKVTIARLVNGAKCWRFEKRFDKCEEFGTAKGRGQTGDFCFKVSPDQTEVMITKYKGGGGIVQIPSEIIAAHGRTIPVRYIHSGFLKGSRVRNTLDTFTNLDNSITTDGFRPITEIRLPEGLFAIFDNTFTNCNTVKRLIIPSTVRFIGLKAFENSGIQELYLNCPRPSTWGSRTFEEQSVFVLPEYEEEY